MFLSTLTAALAVGSLPAQDVAAVAFLPTVAEPEILLVQKTRLGLRWRTNQQEHGVGVWGPWQTGAGPQTQHLDAYSRVALGEWFQRGQTFALRRANAFYEIVTPTGSAQIALGENYWEVSRRIGPTFNTHTLPSSPTGGAFFPRATGFSSLDNLHVFGMSAISVANQPQFRLREFTWNGQSWTTRDPGAQRAAMPVFEMGHRAVAVSRVPTGAHQVFAAYREGNATTSNVLVYFRSEPTTGPLGRFHTLGSPGGTLHGSPVMLAQPVNSSSVVFRLNLFQVAADATGRRNLHERFNADPTVLPNGSGNWGAWRNAGRPADVAGATGADDLTIANGVVWNDGQRVRINLFGTRQNRLVEYWWDGLRWTWSTPEPFPAAMGAGVRVTEAIAAPDALRPYLAVFAVTRSGEVWERWWDWSQQRWVWRTLG
jgi:hypothetical protein